MPSTGAARLGLSEQGTSRGRLFGPRETRGTLREMRPVPVPFVLAAALGSYLQGCKGPGPRFVRTQGRCSQIGMSCLASVVCLMSI